MNTDPHRTQPIHHAGAPLGTAEAVVILLHGRGGSAADILGLAGDLSDERVAYLAPQAAESSWYPYSFLAPIPQNEPWLTSALAKVEATVNLALRSVQTRDRLVVCGFSQGACLGAEFIARNPAAYGGVIAFTGGLIGPPDTNLHHAGSLAGTRALFSSGDPDPHVPWPRVEASANQFTLMGADVELQRHPGRSHSVSPPELASAKKLVAALLQR